MDPSYIDGEQQDDETEQAVSHILKSSDEPTIVSSSSGISVNESGMDDPLDLSPHDLSPELSLAETIRVHCDKLNGQWSRQHTPKSLTRLMQEHRENQRRRHHGLNSTIRELSSSVPSAEKSTKETKIVKMQRTISYICHLENHVQKLLQSHKLKINFKNLFLSPYMKKPFDASAVKECLRKEPTNHPQRFHKRSVIRKPSKVVSTPDKNPFEDLTDDCEDPLQAFDAVQQTDNLVPELSDFTPPDLNSKVSHEVKLENYVEESVELSVEGSTGPHFIHGDRDSPRTDEHDDSEPWSAVAPNDLYETLPGRSNEKSSPMKTETDEGSGNKENNDSHGSKLKMPKPTKFKRSSLRNVTSWLNNHAKEMDTSMCNKDSESTAPLCSSARSGTRKAFQDATQRMRNQRKAKRFRKLPKMGQENCSQAVPRSYCPGKTMYHKD